MKKYNFDDLFSKISNILNIISCTKHSCLSHTIDQNTGTIVSIKIEFYPQEVLAISERVILRVLDNNFPDFISRFNIAPDNCYILDMKLKNLDISKDPPVSLVDIFTKIAKLGNEDMKNDYSLMLKLVEEVGELSEAFNHHKGNLPNKTMKEPLEGEIADVIICALSVLSRVNSNLSPSESVDLLLKYLTIKTAKWESVIKLQHSLNDKSGK